MCVDTCQEFAKPKRKREKEKSKVFERAPSAEMTPISPSTKPPPKCPPNKIDATIPFESPPKMTSPTGNKELPCQESTMCKLEFDNKMVDTSSWLFYTDEGIQFLVC